MDIAAPVKQYNKLREQINPNIEELENFVKAAENFRFCNNDSQNINALRLKYQAMTTIPTTIEKKLCRHTNCMSQTIHSGLSNLTR